MFHTEKSHVQSMNSRSSVWLITLLSRDERYCLLEGAKTKTLPIWLRCFISPVDEMSHEKYFLGSHMKINYCRKELEAIS